MSNPTHQITVWLILLLSLLPFQVGAGTEAQCQSYINQINSDEESWRESDLGERLLQEAVRYEAIAVKGLTGCRILLVELDIERAPPTEGKLHLISPSESEFNILAEGTYPIEGEVGGLESSRLLSATKMTFPNRSPIIRLKTSWSRGGGGFGLGGKDSYYIWLDGRQLRIILGMSDSSGSHYSSGEECSSIEASNSQLKFLPTRKDIWPDLLIASTKTEFTECRKKGKEQVSGKRVSKAQKQFTWTGKRYEAKK